MKFELIQTIIITIVLLHKIKQTVTENKSGKAKLQLKCEPGLRLKHSG